MKKRLFTSVLSILSLFAVPVFGFTGCDLSGVENVLQQIPGAESVLDKVTEFGESVLDQIGLGGKEEVEVEKTISLDATSKALVVGESFTLKATVTPEDAEIVWSSSDEAVVTVKDGVVLAVGEGTATVTAKNDTVSATCEIKVTKVEVEKHTVIFKNGETQLKSVEMEEGSVVAYNGALPSKASTEQYSYTFSGWSLQDGGSVVDISTITVDGDKTFYAVFAETLREYTVTWDIDGKTTNVTVKYGETPEYQDVTPTKPTVGDTSYTFKGWATTLSGDVLAELPTVTGNVTYYAIFDKVTKQTKFTVTWKNGDTVLKTDVDVEYEATPIYTGVTPSKEMTTEVEYVFAGWASSVGGDKLTSLPLVTADTTYYAVFEETARKYTITWVIEGVEETSQCGYGSVPTYEGTPEKADSSECSYKFDGWALSEGGEKVEILPEVSGEATYYATFVVDQVFEAPKFIDGKITYSANSEEIFLPEGLLAEGVSITTATIKAEGVEDVTAYENGAWIHEAITLTEEELKGNLVGMRTLEVRFSDGNRYSVDMLVYAGIIDELSDFPVFFNNTAVANEADNAAEFPMVAPDIYGYYIVTKDLGSSTFDKETNTFIYSDELTLTQTELTNYQKTNGFNGVLDGQGHTLKFKLMKGSLVGMVLGNAVIKNIAVIYEDASFISQSEGGGYGAFGYITNGSPEIRNSYIERTNNVASRSSVFGIMARPNGKLILHNTVVYGYMVPNDCTWWKNTVICPTSTNAYVIHGRANAASQSMAANFTKVYTDAIENGSREVLLSDIEDASGFDDNYWSKENGKLIWKGLETVNVTWVKGDETTVETVTKDGWIMYTQSLPQDTTSETEIVNYYWATSEDGEQVSFGDRFQVKEDVTYYMVKKQATRYYTVTWSIDGVETTTDYEYNAVAEHEAPVKEEDDFYTYEFKGWSLSEDGEIVELGAVTEDGIVYYAVFESTAKITLTTVLEPILYSTDDRNLFLPEELTLTLDETVTIESRDGETVYYENGAWVNTFAITDEQRKANEIGMFEISIAKGTDLYLAKVKSYAGVIDELSDFPVFFNNTAGPSEFDAATYPAVAPNVYGYYIVTKDLGSATDELAMTQCADTDYQKTNGFNGVLDGQGNTLRFKLTSGGLVGMVLGNAVIKNIAIIYEDGTYDSTTKKGGYGVFGFITNGSPEIRNSYIERTNNLYHQGSVFGIMARPNAKLILHNTAVHANNTSNQSGWYSNMWINETSTNAYLIYARSNATGWTNVTNFTEVTTTNTLTSDLSSFDTNYWKTENSQLNWIGMADMAFSSVVKVS